MKKKFKFLAVIFVLLIIPCAMLFTGCNNGVPAKYVVGIERSAESTSITDIYLIKYSDGTTSSFTVENGESGQDLKINDIYDTAVENGYTGTFLDFLEDYLTLQAGGDDTVSAVNKGLLSSVVITCEFPVESGNIFQTTKDIAIGSGAGVIYKLDKTTGDAYIITNYHVVYNSSSNTSDKISSGIRCYLYGADISRTYKTNTAGEKVLDDDGYPIMEYLGNAIECSYVGGSLLNDIAVLKVSNSEILKNSDAKAIDYVNSENIAVGSTAIAIGMPEGAGFSVTKGIISVDSENLTMTGADDLTQVTFRVMRIDTPVNHGNSGGGLYNDKGEFLGIVNAKIIDEEIENVGYAIPSNVALRVADSIIANAGAKCPRKATIGITIEAKNSRSVYDSDTDTISIVQDIIIQSVAEGSLADTYGLTKGDRIKSVKIKGTSYKITRLHQLIDIVWLVKTGDVMYFEIEGRADLVSVIISADCMNNVA